MSAVAEGDSMLGTRGKKTAIVAAALAIVVILAGIVACHGYLLETYFIWKLDSKNQRARWMAHSWLRKHKSERAVPDLMRILLSYEEIDPDIECARTLRAIGPPAVPALAEALRHPNPGMRREIAHILRRMGPEAKGAVPALEERTRDEDPGVRDAAAQALEHIRSGKPGIPGTRSDE